MGVILFVGCFQISQWRVLPKLVVQPLIYWVSEVVDEDACPYGNSDDGEKNLKHSSILTLSIAQLQRKRSICPYTRALL